MSVYEPMKLLRSVGATLPTGLLDSVESSGGWLSNELSVTAGIPMGQVRERPSIRAMRPDACKA